MFTAVLPLILAFGSTIVGLIGNTWNKEKKGLRKLTTTGYIIFSIALISVSFSIHKAGQNAIKREEQTQKDQLLKVIASQEILEAISTLLEPFELIIKSQANDNSNSDHSDQIIDRYLYTSIDYLDRLGTESFLEDLDQIKALDYPEWYFSNSANTYAFLLSRAASRSDKLFIRATERYIKVLAPSTVEEIYSIRSHKIMDIFKSASGNIAMNIEMGNENIYDVTIGWLIRGPHEPSEYYLPFFELLKKLRNKLEKDSITS